MEAEAMDSSIFVTINSSLCVTRWQQLEGDVCSNDRLHALFVQTQS